MSKIAQSRDCLVFYLFRKIKLEMILFSRLGKRIDCKTKARFKGRATAVLNSIRRKHDVWNQVVLFPCSMTRFTVLHSGSATWFQTSYYCSVELNSKFNVLDLFRTTAGQCFDYGTRRRLWVRDWATPLYSTELYIRRLKPGRVGVVQQSSQLRKAVARRLKRA